MMRSTPQAGSSYWQAAASSSKAEPVGVSRTVKINVDAVVQGDLAHFPIAACRIYKGADEGSEILSVASRLVWMMPMKRCSSHLSVTPRRTAASVLGCRGYADDGIAPLMKSRCDTVIHLMVADGDHIRGEGVHDFDVESPVFRIDDRGRGNISPAYGREHFSSLRTFST